MKVSIFGIGYVGLSLALLLARKHQIVAVDIDKDRVDQINSYKIPFYDKDMELYIKKTPLNLMATIDPLDIQNSQVVIIATPTNFDAVTGCFDTSSVEACIKTVHSICPHALCIVKSTIPVGFVESMKSKGYPNVIFSPEFLREGSALYDNLYPDRIIVGEVSERAKRFALMLRDCSEEPTCPIVLTNSNEAEAIKLFSNTYLAMRVAFFNEIDTFALSKNYDVKQIIDGVCLDKRIGNHYNNPSFGYGGYCLPKDTRQLLSDFSSIPQRLMEAIVLSNETRKQVVAGYIQRHYPNKTIGIYRLSMKANSDNYRESAVIDIVKKLKSDEKIIIYEPNYRASSFMGCQVCKDYQDFLKNVDVIVANRVDEQLAKSGEGYKVFSRDLFNLN